MNITDDLMAIAWAAIFLMLAIAGLKELVSRYFPSRRLPFFSMLERLGIEYEDVERAIGPHAVARAMQRCMDCGWRYDCGWRKADCPNEALFDAVLRRKTSAGAA